MDGMFLIWVLVFGAILVGGYLFEQRRREKWGGWASAIGWSYQSKLDSRIARSLRGGPFGQGSSRSLRHVVSGRYNGLPASAMHYSYTTGSGDDRTTHHYYVCSLAIPYARFPLTELSHENWATRLVRDIQFEDAQFNQQWRVTGESHPFAHRVVHPRAMEWLKQRQLPPFTTMWFENDALWIAENSRLGPEDLASYFETLSAFLQTMPRYLLGEVGAPKELGMTASGYQAKG